MQEAYGICMKLPFQYQKWDVIEDICDYLESCHDLLKTIAQTDVAYLCCDLDRQVFVYKLRSQ